MTIVPDTKDWTWVLGAPCPECGFRASSFAREEIPARLPAYPNWDQDETALLDRYGEQDPAAVGTELAAAGDRLADAFEAIHGDQWLCTGNRSDGARFTVESFARYLLHDPVHHLYDVTGRPST